MKMRSRKSLNTNGVTTRRKNPKRRHTLDPNQVNKEQPDKENIQPVSNKSENAGKQTSSRIKRGKRKNVQDAMSEWECSLQANNRALATALEEARIQINEINMKNIHLKKQLQSERQHHIETVMKEVDIRIQEKFKVIQNYLKETATKLIDCAKVIYKATEFTCLPTDTSTNFTPLPSTNTPYRSLDTTPPPQDSDMMEVTSADVVPMETTSVELGSIETIVTELSQLSQIEQNEITSATESDTQSENSDASNYLRQNDSNNLTNDFTNVESSVSIDSRHDTPSIPPIRSKRLSSINVSYTMPSLRRKLRRGDPFTDASFQSNFPSPSKKRKERKGRMSTGCIRKKSRYALSNITNIIDERQEM